MAMRAFFLGPRFIPEEAEFGKAVIDIAIRVGVRRFMHGLLLSSWRRMAEEDVLADAFDSQAKMAYVDYRDVAHVAAIAFHGDRLVRGTFELAAPGEHSPHEIAAMVSEVFGHPIRAEQAPLHDYAPARSLLSNPYSADGAPAGPRRRAPCSGAARRPRAGTRRAADRPGTGPARGSARPSRCGPGSGSG